MYMRVNTGRFAPSSADRIEKMLADSEMQLAPVLKRLVGIRSYQTGIDRAAGTMIAISLWDDAKQADAMNGLPEMNALRDPFQARALRSTRSRPTRCSGKSRGHP